MALKFSFGPKKDPKTEAAQRKLRAATLMQEERKHILSSSSDFFIREAYKTLRTNVSFALADDESSKVVLVTSSLQSEGKSITAVNLAVSYAQADKKVIIIDCDLRRPKLARLLQMRSEIGLSNIIVKPELLERAIMPTEVQSMDVILSGSIPPNPSELLSSPRMQQLIDTLRGHYDYIFLDSPPVNVVTDAVVLAPKSDGVLFLVRANRSERGSVIHAVDQLSYAKAKILGFVLNGVDMEKLHYGYRRYRYSRYFKYAYGKYGYSKYGYGKYGYGRNGYGGGYHYGYSSTMPPAYVADTTTGVPEEEGK